MVAGVHIDLDGAWDAGRLPVGLRTVDARVLGPHLRFTAAEGQLRKAFEVLKEGMGEEKFVLYGSGDFHHLAAWWLRAAIERRSGSGAGREGVGLVSFDNHPDWDVRRPRWGCGGWINRALEFPEIAGAEVWGCGNFELAFPARLFRNQKALAAGRLKVHAWAQRQSAKTARRFDCMTRENWRERFRAAARALAGRGVYVTVDFDALAAEFAVTNWENGLFTPQDIAWAIRELRAAGAEVIGGDCCGAWSPPVYARRVQRWMGKFDHPRLTPRTLEAARAVNHRSLDVIWPALAGE